MDKCCRTHHFCKDVIPVFGDKYGLTNTDIFPKLSCDCEEKFFKCLHKANTVVSNKMGETYFNQEKSQCFMKDYPIVKCLIRKALSQYESICVKYELDATKSKIYQLFDTPFYKVPNFHRE
ncbi:phospholipase A2-like [Centruroides sculpturatus]|uniref:phospholipase A2-like n=1 Tax=Centruroides sculpturatus TaxID=218467 RepID=UPI000C6D67C6|nr:phospholipase A2-like [Centruroides sculpturatus]